MTKIPVLDFSPGSVNTSIFTAQERADAAELARIIRAQRTLWVRGGRSAESFNAGLRQAMNGDTK